MMKWRIGIFLMGLLLASPIILLNLSAISRMGNFERLTNEDGETSVPGVLVNAGGWIDNLWTGHKADVQRDAVFDAEALTGRRLVHRAFHVTIEDVLAEGEADPGEMLHGLYITARAPAYAMRECAAILDRLARTCALASGTKIEAKEEGLYTIEASYAYLPTDPLVAAEGLDAAPMALSRIELAPPEREKLLRATEIEPARRAFYAEAASVCAALREDVGSCAVADLTITESESRRTPGRFEIRGMAELAWLDPDGLPDPAEPKSLAEQIFGWTGLMGGGGAKKRSDGPSFIFGGNAYRAIPEGRRTGARFLSPEN